MNKKHGYAATAAIPSCNNLLPLPAAAPLPSPAPSQGTHVLLVGGHQADAHALQRLNHILVHNILRCVLAGRGGRGLQARGGGWAAEGAVLGNAGGAGQQTVETRRQRAAVGCAMQRAMARGRYSGSSAPGRPPTPPASRRDRGRRSRPASPSPPQNPWALHTEGGQQAGGSGGAMSGSRVALSWRLGLAAHSCTVCWCKLAAMLC